MSTHHPPWKSILPAVLCGAVAVPGLFWILASYSADFKNSLARFGFAIPQRVTDSGLPLGSSPPVMLGGTALITLAGLTVVFVGIAYMVAALRYEEYGTGKNYEVDNPPEPSSAPPGYPGPMPGQMPGYGMPPQGFPGQMPGYGMPPMAQMPPSMGGPMQ